MCVEMLTDFQFIRNVTIGIIVIIKSYYSNYQVTLLLSAAFIRFHSSFLYIITSYVDESIKVLIVDLDVSINNAQHIVHWAESRE
jgi:hypothetical protein